MTWKPLPGKVLIEPDPPPTETESGLALVEHWPEEVSGTVIAAGAKAECQEGQWVIFSEFAPRQAFTWKGQKYVILRDEDVLASVEPA